MYPGFAVAVEPTGFPLTGLTLSDGLLTVPPVVDEYVIVTASDSTKTALNCMFEL